MPIPTLLIDDEPLASAELQVLLKKHPEIEVVALAENGPEALESIRTLRPKLLFLDIQMPGMSGFDLLEQLDEAPFVIFATAYDEHALRAFEYNSLDYLLKPINPLRLAEAVTKVTRVIAEQQQAAPEVLDYHRRVFIKDGEKCFFVGLIEVELIESVGNYARFVFGKNKPLMHRSLNYLEERLPQRHFFRANRNQIINLEYVRGVEPMFKGALQVEMLNGTRVDISQRQSVRFRELLSI